MHIFHGGCIDCLTQKTYGVYNCYNCQYFDADWSKPDLSSKKTTATDILKAKIKEAYK